MRTAHRGMGTIGGGGGENGRDGDLARSGS